jgi:hypothetical protein
MSDTIGAVSGFLINIFRSAFHILLLLLHNVIFVAIAVALLYGMFKLGKSGMRRLRGRGAGAAPEENRSAMDQSQSPPEQNSRE